MKHQTPPEEEIVERQHEVPVDIEKLMEKVRASVAEKLERGIYSPEEVEAVSRMELSLRERRDFGVDMDESMSYLHANWDPNGPYTITSHRPVIGAALVALKKVLRKLLKPVSSMMLIKQTEFNSNLTRLLTTALPSLRDRMQGMEEEWERRFEDLLLKHYELMREHQNLYRRLAETRADVQKNEDRLGRLRPGPATREAGVLPPGDAESVDKGHMMPGYLAFEDRHRGPSREIKEKQRDYLPYFKGAARVIDAGSGRGEFLELLGESGIEAYGVDVSAEMADLCREKGLEVVVADINSHLAGLRDRSLGGVFAAQIVEHMTVGQLRDFVGLACRKLSPGARLVVETINPSCLAVFGGPMYLDLTHTKPIHPEAMRFLMESSGFSAVEIVPRSPFPEEMKLREIDLFHRLQRFEESLLNVVNDNFNQLNELIYGYQDYAAVGTR